MPELSGVRGLRIAVVVPVAGTAAALRPLAERLAAALAGRDWRLRLVIDAAGEESVREAHALAAGGDRIAVTGLTVPARRPGALAAGLAAGPPADGWGCPGGGGGDPPDLAGGDARIAVTGLTGPAGGPGALAAGLAAEPSADVWVCLDGEGGDPPEGVPLLLDRLGRGDVAAVFAGSRLGSANRC